MENGKKFTRNEFTPLPAGDYLVRMNRAEEAATKNGQGVIIKSGFEVINGDFKGRLIFHNFLVEHTNPNAAKIGNDQLNKYLQAVGLDAGLEGLNQDRSLINDYTELPFVASIGIEEAGEYVKDGVTKQSKARNKVFSFKKR